MLEQAQRDVADGEALDAADSAGNRQEGIGESLRRKPQEPHTPMMEASGIEKARLILISVEYETSSSAPWKWSRLNLVLVSVQRSAISSQSEAES